MPGETYITASGQYFDGDDVATLVECVLGEWYAEGKYADEFSKDIRTYFENSIRHVVLANSGSSANLLAVTTITDPAFGSRQAKAGDEIITVAAGFPTTINPIIQNNLSPVFVDVNLDTLLPDMDVIENSIIEGVTKASHASSIIHIPYSLQMSRNVSTS